MPWPSTGEKLPLVTSPTVLAVDDHGAARPRRAPAFGGDADEVAVDAPLALRHRRLLAAELRLVPRDHPRQPGLQRRDAGTELVPVERQAGLETQRVACPEARPAATPAADDRRPQRLGLRRRHGDLEPASPV